MLNIIQEYIHDFSIFFGWLGDVLHTIITLFILPLNFVFTYVKAFLVNCFSAPSPTGISYVWNNSVLAVFHSLPYWSAIQTALIAGIGIIIAFFILKVLTKI